MYKGKHITLGIESSCDETAVGIVADGRTPMANIISSQIDIHTKFGGVVPEIASRNHLKNINPVIAAALDAAGIGFDEVDLIGVTYGPGLVGSLLVGVAAAKAISYMRGIPLVGVNHMHGHVAANYIEFPDLKPPFMGLVVSGGHTNIIYVHDYNVCEKIGSTRDDAAGEAFDKVARVIGLGYPGGPKIDKSAKKGDRTAIHFKRVYLEDGSYDFSFSGLKTAVLNYINTEKQAGREICTADIAAGFQEAVMEVITDKTVEAANEKNQKLIAVAGGVAANSRLRELLTDKAGANGIRVIWPDPGLCTDNGLMIACSAYYMMKNGRLSDMKLEAEPGLEF